MQDECSVLGIATSLALRSWYIPMRKVATSLYGSNSPYKVAFHIRKCCALSKKNSDGKGGEEGMGEGEGGERGGGERERGLGEEREGRKGEEWGEGGREGEERGEEGGTREAGRRWEGGDVVQLKPRALGSISSDVRFCTLLLFASDHCKHVY